MTHHNLRSVAVCLWLFLSLVGCAPIAPTLTGSPFQLQEIGERGMGQVYIYRMLTPPTLRSPDVIINGKMGFDLIAGGFGRVGASPGEMLIETKWRWDTGVENRSVQFRVEPDQTYFVRCHTDMWGLVFNSKLQVVPSVIGLYELEGLKELSGSPLQSVKGSSK